MNLKSTQKTVFVGLSGGVDSSVAAYLLKKQGYKVVGAFIKTWQPDFIECTWKDERRDAMRVAAHLEIPFITIDLEKEYKEGVADYMIREYKEGRTPNPDVMCNKEIKFGGFLRKAMEMGADYIATGHYSRVDEDSRFKIQDSGKLHKEKDFMLNIQYRLLKAVDEAKEQSYFLWTLNQEQLLKTLFPIGHLQKSEVRKIAKKAGLLTAEKKDSQGICFIGKIDFKDFLKHFIEPKKGDVLNDKGEVIGEHEGAVFLTLGERQGFTITKKGTSDKPLFVVAKDMKSNTIVVNENPAPFHRDDLLVNISQINWINETPSQYKKFDAQVRYHQDYQKCTVEAVGHTTATIRFEKPQVAASGQSIVMYDGEVCLGGGIIE